MLAQFIDELREVAHDHKINVVGDRIVVAFCYPVMDTLENPSVVLLSIQKLAIIHTDCLKSMMIDRVDLNLYTLNTITIIFRVADNVQLVLW